MVWGKLIGGFFGWLLMMPLHIPWIGLMLGIWVGHRFDKAFQGFAFRSFHVFSDRQAHVQQVYFDLTFSIMGYLAKSDGVVSADEIKAARHVMQRLQMNAQARRRGIDAFTQGKAPDFDLDQALFQLKQICFGQMALLKLFVDVQIQIVLAEGHLSKQKERTLRYICQSLGVPESYYAQYVSAHADGSSYSSSSSRQSQWSGHELGNAYRTLEISSTASPDQIKRAYRKLIGQYHPDRLVAKGLPEEMIKVANQKTREIKRAYDDIRKHRGF